MNLLDSTTLDMGQTATYTRREIQWFPFDENGFGGVIIRQWFKSRKRGTARLNQESDLYQVVEVEPEPGEVGRCFRLLNVCDPEQTLPYRVVIGPVPKCSCKAGQCHAPSDKHVEGLALLIKEGVLDGFETPDDAARSGLAFHDAPGEPTVSELV